MVKLQKLIISMLIFILFSCSQEIVEVSPTLTCNIKMSLGGSVNHLRRLGFADGDKFAFSYPTNVVKTIKDSVGTYELQVEYNRGLTDDNVKAIYIQRFYYQPQYSLELHNKILKNIRSIYGKESSFKTIQVPDSVKLYELTNDYKWYLGKTGYVLKVSFFIDTISNQRFVEKGYFLTIDKE